MLNPTDIVINEMLKWDVLKDDVLKQDVLGDRKKILEKARSMGIRPILTQQEWLDEIIDKALRYRIDNNDDDVLINENFLSNSVSIGSENVKLEECPQEIKEVIEKHQAKELEIKPDVSCVTVDFDFLLDHERKIVIRLKVYFFEYKHSLHYFINSV